MNHSTNPAYKFLKKQVLKVLKEYSDEFFDINYQHDHIKMSNYDALLYDIKNDINIDINFAWFLSEHFEKHWKICSDNIIESQFDDDFGNDVYVTIYKFGNKYLRTLWCDTIFEYKFVKRKSKKIVQYYYE